MASVTLQKARRILQKDGPASLLSRGFKQVTGNSAAFASLRFGHASDGFGDAGEIDGLIDYGNKLGGGVIGAFQVRSEITRLLTIVRELKPKSVLEIGTANGGTLFLFSRVADPSAHLISVDLPAGTFGEGYAKWRIPLYHSFARGRQSIDLIRGDSHNPATLKLAQSKLKSPQVDFLFIDGDHTYAGVKQDYELFSPLVRPGGIIAFHDIAHHAQDCEVERLWNELKDKPGAETVIENVDQGWAGIGILRV